MIASLLSPTSTQPKERISQLLPTVKCSTCHKPVPLTDLGEHLCSGPPPPVPPAPAPAPAPNPPRHQREGSTASSRLRINTLGRPPPSPTNQSFKSSPLAQGNRQDTSTPRPREREPTPPTAAAATAPRTRTPSNAGSNQSTPSTARPPVSFNNQETTPVQTVPSRPPFPNVPQARGTPPPMGAGPGPGQRNGPPPPNGIPFPRGPPPPGGLGGSPPGPPAIGYPQRTASAQGGGPPGPSIGYPQRTASAQGGGPPPQLGGPRAMGPGHPGPGPRMASFPPPKSDAEPPSQSMVRPEEAFVHPAERGINTKSGGEAGMAGVGRRGFAAAARAAMFVHPMHGIGGQYNRRPNAPQFLDIDVSSRPTTETPPLSAGSGHSSHSPGPTSPGFSGPPPPNQIRRTPSPSAAPPGSFGFVPTTTTPGQPSISTKPTLTLPLSNDPSHIANMNMNGTLSSPLSPRLPFFEKFKNKIPGMMSPATEVPPDTLNHNDHDNGFGVKRPRAGTTATATSSSSHTSSSKSGAGLGYLARSVSAGTGSDTSATSLRDQSRTPVVNHSANSTKPNTKTHGNGNGPKSPPSSADSGSEYSGLAYADSTDYEDDDHDLDEDKDKAPRRKNTPPPPVPPLPKTQAQAFMRSVSNSSRVQFGSVSGRSRSRSHSRSGLRMGDRTTVGGSTEGGRPSLHSRENSASSYSSATDAEGEDVGEEERRGRDVATRPGHARTRSNSSVIAQALGLSQRPPSEYGRLGGPGVHRAESRRLGRSVSGSSNGSFSARGSAVGNGGAGAGAGEEKQQKQVQIQPPLPQDAINLAAKIRKQSFDQILSSSSQAAVRLRSMSRERSAKAAASLAAGGEAGDESVLMLAGAPKAQRSNTVQGVQSPDVKPIKLPMRAQSERDSSDRGIPKRARKVRHCLKCAKSIDDGRWVQVDGGGILCEKCWKNMYLPKCRRCNLPIERQAVSSSDGQLKGKYHKECFNCHQCHTPFPDKTFYVYDGKPLCAYHYHEANDSLCAAARCGQPIEGPCAVSHTGDRYHPEHMTCEYPGYPECRERLNEYWEVDGRMLCERHAVYSSRMGSEVDTDEDGSERWGKARGAVSTRAMKRVTRFIDLANGGETPRDSLVGGLR
ncbi:hypothetical protein CPB83DRAFT_903757 [Crepidotus variabilis]|uniref:LIM zinc-binding domain-containing protein n=1 Tax=Crepidotus variabilis TaxID=179855 RepID=A0A9P6ENV8_9AGAR|nr:hypothetical protein CPB83DRAFT_903757 [Crepidotus variabilis]